MKRTLLALCLSLLAGLAFADESATGNVNEAPPLCPKAAPKVAATAPATDGGAAIAPEATSSRARGGGNGTTRLVSPRWHSLLPGMFR